MAPRASWKGYLKLSLVSCPIALYPATSSSERISFNRINKKTGNRLKQQLVDAETGETVEKEDIGRGYEIGKASTSKSRTRRLRRSGSKAPTPSRSTPLSRDLKSTIAISTTRIILPPQTRLVRRRLPSSAMRSAKKRWSL
jgi:hypothetical protein